MVVNTEKELQKLFNVFGWNTLDSAISRTIDLANAEKMKNDEENYRTRNPRYTLQFVKGPNTQVSREVRRFIVSECREELDLLGYLEAE